jgi:hypothetical protein
MGGNRIVAADQDAFRGTATGASAHRGRGTKVSGSNALLHDVSLVLFDTGMRPEECHRMRWESVNWSAGRHGMVLIEKGKTKSSPPATRCYSMQMTLE